MALLLDDGSAHLVWRPSGPHRLAAELQRHGCAFGDAEERRDLLDEDGDRLPAVKSAISPAYGG
jgi:hypothetical protein